MSKPIKVVHQIGKSYQDNPKLYRAGEAPYFTFYEILKGYDARGMLVKCTRDRSPNLFYWKPLSDFDTGGVFYEDEMSRVLKYYANNEASDPRLRVKL